MLFDANLLLFSVFPFLSIWLWVFGEKKSFFSGLVSCRSRS